MKRQIVTLPLSLMRVTSIDWDIDWRGAPEAGLTDGNTQVVMNQVPRWVGHLDMTMRDDWLRSWRAHRWQAQGRVGIYRLYMFDPLGFNLQAIVGRAVAETGIPFATGERFSSGSGFSPNVYLEAAAAASAGDTYVTVTCTDADLVPAPGQIMSAGDWPMGVVSVEANGDDTYTLGIQMPLRADMAAGDLVSCMATGLFEVDDDLAGAAPYGKLNRSAFSVSFREVLNR
ncbi:hypothetical protein AL035_17750 [Salipiger aestuarii]|uniref:Uncharacterized protein n=1 Tax=Salipiger aestuarii TaxID=568098 RepID=A0A327YU08_9RHOB|nr:hypothetical protein [Salipiger aestuarii]KAB2539655.1 hypothetical protein AL035_17750 [Salipiger aestuarii]RAK24112.1 hypothetical protein ATI53_1001219 [Salipiger aestuarii]